MATISIAPEVSRERIIDWVQRFVRYPSEWSERLEESPAVLGFIGDCIAPLARELGFSPEFDPMGNMVIEAGNPDHGRELMFMTYAMTHPASSMTEPFAGELVDRDGRQFIRGRGVSEQKAGIAAALAAFYVGSQRIPLKGRLTFVLSTAGETGRHLAAETMARHMGRVPDLA